MAETATVVESKPDGTPPADPPSKGLRVQRALSIRLLMRYFISEVCLLPWRMGSPLKVKVLVGRSLIKLQIGNFINVGGSAIGVKEFHSSFNSRWPQPEHGPTRMLKSLVILTGSWPRRC
ncbi:hypothetical protein MLD38_015764 [Melastoma candidum]|uniref:Uncharacterized protein n=1 Tax=Melastoma candidum TaxID=119954 RepID=A0ACB9RQP0_9MYRT|nr:hypothetical protein MLD38_015764 [Melastoma candidum]